MKEDLTKYMNPTLLQFLTLLIPVIVGIGTVPLFDLIKKLSSLIDGLPDAVKQLLVLVIAYLLNLLGSALGVTLPTTLGGLDSMTVGTLLSAILAYILKNAAQLSTIKAVTHATATTVGSPVSNPVSKS
jgi:hypothetical protein